MSIIELIELIGQLLAKYLTRDKFTGKLMFTIHCRNGGIARTVLNAEYDFNKKTCISEDE
jgi:hypothetical protein